MRRGFSGSHGFTLIELLVVVATIAILAAMMYPLSNRAWQRARLAQCLSNLKQIGLGVRMYSDDSSDATPTLRTPVGGTNIISLYSAYKELMKNYVAIDGPVSSKERIFACPADTFYPSFVTNGPFRKLYYVRGSLHDQPIFDFSSYAFNGGNNILQPVGTNDFILPGLGGVKLSAIKNPCRTTLVSEVSALIPWSWHTPSPKLWFNDARNSICFVDGHVSYVKIYFYWDHRPGPLRFALNYDPPAAYEYQWSPN